MCNHEQYYAAFVPTLYAQKLSKGLTAYIPQVPRTQGSTDETNAEPTEYVILNVIYHVV